jgi:hypothetical protein
MVESSRTADIIYVHKAEFPIETSIITSFTSFLWEPYRKFMGILFVIPYNDEQRD